MKCNKSTKSSTKSIKELGDLCLILQNPSVFLEVANFLKDEQTNQLRGKLSEDLSESVSKTLDTLEKIVNEINKERMEYKILSIHNTAPKYSGWEF